MKVNKLSSFFFKFVISLRDGHCDYSLGAQRETARHCWQYFHSLTRGRHCEIEMIQVILHQTVPLVRAVTERTSAIMCVYVYCQSSKDSSSGGVYSAIIFGCRTNEWLVYACSILLTVSLQAATVAQTSVEGRLHLNDSVHGRLHLRATNVK
jgi:hypothetical protein